MNFGFWQGDVEGHRYAMYIAPFIVAIAIMMEGDTPGEDTGGGRYAAPVAGAIFKAWAAKTGFIGTTPQPPPPAP